MASEEVCYHVAGSDKELVQQVNNLLQEEGAICVRDKLGNSHYLIDGSRGPQQAGRIIQRQNLIREVLAPRQWASSFQLDHYQERAIYQELEQWRDQDRLIEATLNRHPFDRSLQGYTILKYAMACLIPDQSLMKPVKGLYHLCAQEHQTSVACVERNLRSLFKRLALAEHGDNSQLPQSSLHESRSTFGGPLLEKPALYTNVNCLCRLFDEMYRIFHGFQSRDHEEVGRAASPNSWETHAQLSDSSSWETASDPISPSSWKASGDPISLNSWTTPGQATSQYPKQSAASGVAEPPPFKVRDVAQGKYAFDLKPKVGSSGIRQLAAAYEKYLAAVEHYRLEGTAQSEVKKELLQAKLQSIYLSVHEELTQILAPRKEGEEEKRWKI